MRRCYLVCYDICNPKRLRHVHKTMKGYGEPWQYSVFFCNLKEIDLVRMRADLKEKMDIKKDQVLIIDLGINEEQSRQSAIIIGEPLPELETGTIVI